MSTMQSEVFDAFRSIGVAEDKALKADMSVMKWMLGFILAFQIGIFVKLFIH